jgi:glycogen synthase
VMSLLAADVPGYDSCQRASGWFRRSLSRRIWHRADRVVVASDSLGRLAMRTSPGLRYSVVYLGVDLARFRPRAAHHVRKDETIRCLAVSQPIRSRGLANLIRAISSLEPGRFELEILCSGPAEGSLRALVSSLGVGDRVTFSGAIGRGQIARRYRSADLFAVASWEEAFDSGLAEALASGLPIVGPEIGAMPSLVQQGHNGLLVPPRDSAALAGAIARLADDATLRGQLGQRNRAEAEATLSWERVAARYLSIYQGILHHAPARPRLAELPTSTW